LADERDQKGEILRRLDMAQVVGEYVQLQRRGERLWGLCPFHNEKTPSFSVNPDRGVFYCFGCHKGGDLFAFVMEIEKISFVDALRHLAEKAGVELGQARSPADERREALLELNRRVAGSLAWLLRESRARESEAAREYVRDRGFDAGDLERFQVGYAPEDRGWLARFLEERGYSQAFLRSSGLVRDDGSGLFRGRVMFPIENVRGEILGFGGRALGQAVPKYLNSPETPVFRKREAVFGLRQAVDTIRKSGSFCLMEGYTDVISSHRAGVTSAVATLGTALSDDQIKLLRRYAGKAVLVPDADEAGRTAALRSLEALESAGFEVEVARLPAGQDPADIARDEGGDKLQKLLKYPISGFEYLLEYAQGRFDSRTPGGKEGIFRQLLPLIRKTSSEVKRDGYFDRLADALGVRVESLRVEFARGGAAVRDAAPAAKREAGVTSVAPELYMMLAVAANPEQYAALRARELRLEDLQDPRARELCVALEESYRAEEQGLRPLLDRIEGADLRALVLEKAASEEFAVNPDALIRGAVRWHRRERLEARRQRLVGEIRQAEREDPDAVRRLIEEKMSLDQEIEGLRVGKDVGPAE
jgi:DNA primase